MVERIRAFSVGTEFTIVIAGAFGWFFLGILLDAVFNRAQPPTTQGHLWFLLFYESAVLVCLCAFLRIRGWTLDRLGLRPTLRDVGVGALLAVAGYVASITVLSVFAALSQIIEQPITQGDPGFEAGIALATIAAVSIVNPIFEEIFVSGYVISVLKGRTTFWTAVGASAVIRLGYHLYQGPAGLIGIAPVALIFASSYYRGGRLWPLIVAHGLLDFFGLLAAAYT